jgi:hypothetical protein
MRMSSERLGGHAAPADAMPRLGSNQLRLLRDIVANGGMTKGQMWESALWRAADTLEHRGLLFRGFDHVYVATERGRAVAAAYEAETEAAPASPAP